MNMHWQQRELVSRILRHPAAVKVYDLPAAGCPLLRTIWQAADENNGFAHTVYRNRETNRRTLQVGFVSDDDRTRFLEQVGDDLPRFRVFDNRRTR